MPRVFPGYGYGLGILYPPKTRTRAMGTRVWWNFKLRSKSPAHHAFLSATMCQAPPQPPKSRTRIAKDGKWVVHLPISQEGKSLFPFYSDFDLILKLWQICIFHHPENVRVHMLLRVVSCSSPPPSHHPRKWVRVLVFDGGWLTFITTKPTTIKNEHDCSFLMVVGCSLPLSPPYTIYPPRKTSRYAHFRWCFHFIFIKYFILIL
jgi:hypothetical protein